MSTIIKPTKSHAELIHKTNQRLQITPTLSGEEILNQVYNYSKIIHDLIKKSNISGLSLKQIQIYNKLIKSAYLADDKNLKNYFIQNEINKIFSTKHQQVLLCSNLYHKPVFSYTKLASPFIRKSFKEHMQLFLINFDDKLLSKASIDKLNEHFDVIPDYFQISSFLLELRLDSDPAADFSVSFSNEASNLFYEHIPNTPAEVAAFEIIARYQLDPAKEAVPSWIEFDEIDFNKTNNDLNLFISCPEKCSLQNIVSDITSYGINLNLNNLSLLYMAFFYIPKGAGSCELGIMQSRNNAMKLVVFGFPITKVIDYLKKIKWNGNYNLLINLIDIIKDFNVSIALSIDINEKIENKIGLEIHSGIHSKDITRKKQLCEIFNLLNSKNLKTELNQDKINALKQFPLLTVCNPFGVFINEINHIKFSVDQEIKSKAYIKQSFY